MAFTTVVVVVLLSSSVVRDASSSSSSSDGGGGRAPALAGRRDLFFVLRITICLLLLLSLDRAQIILLSCGVLVF